MEKYHHILLVANCSKEDEDALIQQITYLTDQQSTRLSLVYLIPAIPPYYLQCPASLELEKQLKVKAELQLVNLMKKLDVSNVSHYIKTGGFEREINELAQALQVDLVVMAKSPEYNRLKQVWHKLLHLTPNNKPKKIYIHSMLI
jgi:nucleotide-binding universal stress UspA family protein